MQELALGRIRKLGCRSDLTGYKTTLGAFQVSSVGLRDLCSKYMAPTKIILDSVEKTSKDFHIGFLRGVFDADGSVQGNLEKGVSIRLSQSCLQTLEISQRMLARLGVVSTIYSRRPAGYTLLPDGTGTQKLYPTKENFDLVVSRNSFDVFMDTIGFESPEKQQRAESIRSGRTRSPYQDCWYATVVGLEKDGEEEVYDCAVQDVHEYDANGIASHNCGEICLSLMGGYCVIGDICLNNVEDPQEALDAARLMPRFLMRVNRMPSLYASEVERTNRIGVGLTGVHEFAWKHFNLTFRDLLDEDKAFEFWAFIGEMRRTVEQSAVNFAEVTNVAIPHTFTTMKPSGTISKVMDCTEGAHLAAMSYYIRWVQYALDDPAVQEHKDRGYPVKDVSKQYVGHCVIGFPTKMPIADLMGGELVTAADVTPIDQYTWLRLLETHWLGGDGKNNQVSYTLKYDPEAVNYYQFTEMILENQPLVRACSVMPQINESAYAYVPEEEISEEQYDEFVSKIDRFAKEAVDSDRIDCDSGACPVEPNING